MIGIIGAMEIEIAGLVADMTEIEMITAGRLTAVVGKLCGKKVAVCRCGIGKVNASMASVFLSERYSEIELIVNLGVAGGIKPGIKQGDIVVGMGAVQHDYDQTQDGLAIGHIPGFENRVFACEESAANRMACALSHLGYPYYQGVIASGDQFIRSKTRSQEIYREFGAYACDMETAAIAQVCAVYGKPFLGVRSISDNADGGAAEDFAVFALKAAEKIIKAVKEFLKQL